MRRSAPHTFELDERARALARVKGDRTVSVCIPALNEAATIGGIVASIRLHLKDRSALVDEIVVMDHSSTDATAAVATLAGARVVDANVVAAEFGRALGKGDVLWRSVQACEGDLIVWLDADLESFTPDYVIALLGPLLLSDTFAMVRANYSRSLGGDPNAGGRVTELTARPALKLLFPDLAHIRQPLGGEYAIRRDVAEALPFEVDYGVEVGLLIDVARHSGVGSIAQVDLGTRVHRNRPLAELHDQAVQVLRALTTRAGMASTALGPTCRPPVRSSTAQPKAS